MTNTQVILVDENDNKIGTMDKLEAHQKGALHRAFSVFIFHPDGRLMLQKRAEDKYHSAGLWTNTCCSHPRPGESVMDAAHRRLKEEMGFDCPLTEVHSLIYRTEFSNGLIEHEFDHVLVGTWNGEPKINPSEVSEWLWVLPETLRDELLRYPEKYSYWLKAAFEQTLVAR